MAGFDDLFDILIGRKKDATPPAPQSLQDRWTDYINQVQNGAAPASTASTNPLAAFLPFFGGGKAADNQGFGQPGPASPVDYERMRSILNSGVLRPPAHEGAAPVSAPVAQAPSPAPPRKLPSNPIEALLAMFGRN